MRRLLRNPVPLIGVLCFALVSLVLTLIVGGTLSRATKAEVVQVQAQFRDAAGLRPGDDVRMAGVRVGRVVDTRLDGEVAVVTIEVDRAQRMDEATSASINYLNLMGQRYVALESPDRAEDAAPAPALDDGATIPLSRTRPALDLTALFNAFRPLFDMLRPGDVNELAENLVAVLQGEGPTLRNLTRQTATLTKTLVDRDEVIGSVVDNVTLVMETAHDHRKEITTLVDELGTLTEGLAKDRTAIGRSMDSLQETTTLGADVLEEIGPSITRDVARLGEFSRFLASQKKLLTAAVSGLPKQLGTYIRTLSYGSFLNVYICTLTIKLPGVPGLDLMPGDQASERCR